MAAVFDRTGLLCLLRADIYLPHEFQELGAHAITLNAYMGSDTVLPFLKDPAKGVFVLCKVIRRWQMAS